MKKNSIKRLMAIAAAFAMAAGLVGCGGSSTKSTTAATETGGQSSSASSDTDWPQKPIQLIVPVKAGGDTDINARIFAKYLTDELGQAVTVVNVGGAGGSIGTQQLMDSDPDGYNILWYHNSTVLNTVTGVTDTSYEDLQVADIPLYDRTAVLVARADSGWKDFNDMIEYAKVHPGEIKVGMETATLAHLVPLTIEKNMDVKFNIVDIGAAAERMAGLLGGQIDMYFVQYGAIKDYIDNGDFVALCALSDERNEAYPDIPTAKEFGCDISFDKFFYFAFPKGTDQSIADKFNNAVQNVINNEDMRAEFAELYLIPEYYDTAAALQIMAETTDFYMEYQDLLK